ncbi:MAG: hypothetical protein UC928_04920, partial [Collinsella sp.]|nr:hypothetical protein [Collinsella sp.]
GYALVHARDPFRRLAFLGGKQSLSERGPRCYTHAFIGRSTHTNPRRAQFSLDGLRNSHERMRGLSGLYDRVLDAIDLTLNETSLHLSIAFCPTSFNTNDFKPVCTILRDLLKSSGRTDRIDIRVQPLMLLGRARRNRTIRPSANQYRKLVSTINELRYDSDYRGYFMFEWGDPIDHLIRFPQLQMQFDQVAIHANGDIVASPYIPLVIGNVRKHSLQDYYDAGMATAWSRSVVIALANRMHSIDEMEEVSSLIADINMGGDLRVDLIEDDLDDLSVLPHF